MSGVERSRGRGKGRGRGRGRGRGQEKDGNKEKRPGRSHRDQSGYEDRESMRPATNRSTGPPSDGGNAEDRHVAGRHGKSSRQGSNLEQDNTAEPVGVSGGGASVSGRSERESQKVINTTGKLREEKSTPDSESSTREVEGVSIGRHGGQTSGREMYARSPNEGMSSNIQQPKRLSEVSKGGKSGTAHEPSDRYTLTPCESPTVLRQPNQSPPGQTSATTPGHQPSGHTSGHQPSGHTSGHQPSGHTSGHQASAHTSGHQPSGHTSGHQPSGHTSGHQASAHTSGHQASAHTSGRVAKSGTVAMPGKFPRRPGYGRKGRAIPLLTNFFKVHLPSDLTLYHYDVVIEPSVPKAVKRKVMQIAVVNNKDKFIGQYPVFDGEKNLYCHKKLSNSEIKMEELVQTDGGRERQFKMTVKFTGHVIQLSDLERVIGNPEQRMDIIQAVDLVLRQGAILKPDAITVGRSFFTPTRSSTATLGDGREVWFGYFQSARPSMWKTVLLNIDIAATAFHKAQPVLDFLQDVLCGDRRRYDVPDQLNPDQRRRFCKEIKGLKIRVTHLSYPRQYKVNDITSEPASKLTFPLMVDGQNVDCTVKRYFADTHKVVLKYPNLSCLHVGPKDKHIFIPMECCEIAKGQRCIKKLTDMQLRNMIKYTAKPPEERRRDIMEKVMSAKFHDDPILREYGLKVHTEMEKVQGRVLEAPSIKYKEEIPVNPRNGAWLMKDHSFCSAVELKTWVVAVCADSRLVSDRDIWNFIDKLRRHSMSLGMRLAEPCDVVYQKKRQMAEQLFRELCSQYNKLELIMAILPKKGSGSGYAEVKRAGDNKVGVRTQCVVASTLRKTDPSTLTNVCLKINAKLGGTNSTISRSKFLGNRGKPVIVMGADVTHPAPGETKRPSIAALVASMDVNATWYRVDTRIQECRKEIITDTKEMAKGMMKVFYHTNHGIKPEHILFYRDGVSEGQFQAVLENELQQLQRACEELERDYRPSITFVVVQKRHHARFFPMNERDKIGKSGNVPAGTAVDTSITHPTDHDFYLCSHNGIQGTSKPCHYHVLHDDVGYSADELQEITFQLCHLFPRCNRSVSYPAPAYCAHLAAFRARYLLQDWEDKSDDASSSSSGGGNVDWSSKEMSQAIKIDDEIKKVGMYFA